MTCRSTKPITRVRLPYFVCFAPILSIAALSSAPIRAEGFMWADGYQMRDIYADEAPRRTRAPQRSSVLPKGAEKAEKAAAAGRKPQGPLVIAVSIQHQNVKVYDANGLFAESPISSGMAGHSTPMGVFSVIQKSKYHRSNIYSGAPMPYMQRITWSGIALHAGVLPGYPASHGCIRMPMSFAMRMWGWTRMGARVVVSPGEVSPAPITSAVLDALVPPAPVADATPANLAKIKTADASMTAGSAKVMVDAGVTAMDSSHVASADVATVASVAEPQSVTESTGREASEDGLPPLPAPAAIDLSDIATPALDAPAQAADVAAETSAGAAIDPPPSIAASAPEEAVAAPSPVAAPLIKRNLPVAIFVSRKDGKLYVRQNFAPVLDMPIEIAASDKALGTHVFTAHAAADEPHKLQWSVVTMPAAVRHAAGTEQRGRKSKLATTLPVQSAVDTPDEALGRLAIPPELMSRLGEALPNGSSLVVSDQGIAQGETGEGTDFIVRLR